MAIHDKVTIFAVTKQVLRKKVAFLLFFSFHAAEKHCYKYCFSINVTKTNTLIY